MHRFYLPTAESQAPTLVLDGREAHHASHVLRVRPGERVVVLNGAGTECLCEVIEVAREQVRLKAVEHRMHPAPDYELTLLQALPKGKLFESIVQKAAELGAARVVPVLSERVVAHVEKGDAFEKQKKWQLTAIEALKQCGAPWLLKVEAPLTLDAMLARKERCDLALVGSLAAGSRHPREYFRAFEREKGHKPKSVCVWVGPEGDFTPAELQSIQAAGALPITLGPLVLRVETAAIYCLSVVSYELADG